MNLVKPEDSSKNDAKNGKQKSKAMGNPKVKKEGAGKGKLKKDLKNLD